MCGMLIERGWLGHGKKLLSKVGRRWLEMVGVDKVVKAEGGLETLDCPGKVVVRGRGRAGCDKLSFVGTRSLVIVVGIAFFEMVAILDCVLVEGDGMQGGSRCRTRAALGFSRRGALELLPFHLANCAHA